MCTFIYYSHKGRACVQNTSHILSETETRKTKRDDNKTNPSP